MSNSERHLSGLYGSEANNAMRGFFFTPSFFNFGRRCAILASTDLTFDLDFTDLMFMDCLSLPSPSPG